MGAELYFAFVTAAIILIIIPGPTNMVIVSSAMKFGFKRSIWTMMGAALSHSLFFLITCLGVATLLLASAELFEFIRWVGVVYLIWLGVKLWMTKEVDFNGDKRQQAASPGSLFLQGFAVNTTNPKALIFYSAFFPPFVNPDAPVAPQLITMGITFVSIFILNALCHGYIANLARTFFQNPRRIMMQNWIAGTLLIGAGVLLAGAEKN